MGMTGTHGYMAPEIVRESYDFDGEKADIFSLGVLLFILFFGQPPFVKACQQECKYWRMFTNTPQKFFRLHPNTKALFNKGSIDPDLQELLMRMMSADAAQRPTLDEIESHSYI